MQVLNNLAMTIEQAHDDAGKPIPGLFQGCVKKRHWQSGTETIARLSERRLPEGLAWVDAFMMHQKMLGAGEKQVAAIESVLAA